MSILEGDIKVLASQVMSDTDEGGGAPTSTVIVDATSNSIFPDISELDRAGGRVNLRKAFACVQTPTTDTYLGANVIVADVPADPLVSVTIFKAETFDVRMDARDRIEAYLNKGSMIDGYLLENHITGQRALQIFQRESSDTPAVGATLYLVANEGLATEYYQYVRVTEVSSEVRTFSYSTGSNIVDYKAKVTTCELSDALRHDFSGSPPSRLYQMEQSKSKLRACVVADAGSYYGATPVTAAIAIGDVATSVKSIYTQLVPSAQTETALTDMTAGGTSATLIPASDGTVSYTTSSPFNASTALSLGSPIQPGTLVIAYSGGTMTDAGGQLLDGSTVVGAVNYANSTVTFASSAPTYTGSKTITFKPAAAPVRIADTLGIAVTIESRAYNYVQTIVPAPAPGTLQVSYYAQGVWYTLYDNGAGKLIGAESSHGVGTVSYSTGTVLITLGALPDVGSEILYAWGGKANYFNRADQVPGAMKVMFALVNTGITPGSLIVEWNDGAARSATDDGAGKITGSATGEINYATGAVTLVPATLPLAGQTYDVSYTFGNPETASFQDPLRETDGSVVLDLGATNLRPGSVALTWNLVLTDYTFLSNTPAEMQYAPGHLLMVRG